GSEGDGEFPTQDFRFIIPFDPGGGADVWSRGIFPTVADILGVGVEFEHISGAGGTRGFAELANAEPDGHTLSVSSAVTEIAHITNETEHNWLDMTTAGIFTQNTREIIFANQDLGVESWDDLFQAYNDEEISNFGVGDATGSHSATVAAMLDDGTFPDTFNRVTYDGSGPTLEAVINGEIPAGLATDTAAAGEGFTENVDVLGAVTEDASQVIPAEEHVDPDTLSLAAAGYPAYQRLGNFFYAYYLPPETPIERRNVIGDALEEALETDEVQDWAEESGNVLGPYSSPEEHEAIRDESWEVLSEAIDVERLENL
ncbi:MAG: tripartite tricarboxylate transporter substrate-binding protein, partial [Natronomonas sp.]